MIVAIPMGPDGRMGHSWGKARAVAVADVAAGVITGWSEHEVRWDALHDEGTHGSHHARVVRFLRDNGVEAVVVDHVGEGMRRTLTSMGVALHEGHSGDARQQVLAAAGAGGS
jgi:predicted Fe-Mo cluster-binding NifX family protein